MSATVYEGMFILDSQEFNRDPDKISGEINRLIEEAGAEVLVSRIWEERKLAYPIAGHKKGVYWLTYFQMNGTQLSELEREFRLQGSIIRFLLLRVDARIADTLVEHARAGQIVPDRAEPENASPEPAAKEDTKEEPVVAAE